MPVSYVKDKEEARRARAEINERIRKGTELVKKAGGKSTEGFYMDNDKPRSSIDG